MGDILPMVSTMPVNMTGRLQSASECTAVTGVFR